MRPDVDRDQSFEVLLCRKFTNIDNSLTKSESNSTPCGHQSRCGLLETKTQQIQCNCPTYTNTRPPAVVVYCNPVNQATQANTQHDTLHEAARSGIDNIGSCYKGSLLATRLSYTARCAGQACHKAEQWMPSQAT
jgi:hypothetical protein